MSQLVHVEVLDRVGVLTITRPEQRNALNLQVKRELVDGLRHLAGNEDVGAVVLTGAGGVFVAGTDIGEMVDMGPGDHPRLETGLVFQAVRASPKPVIAAVEGYALGGGCELALACDLVIAAENARFGQPEIKLGIMPGAGGTQRMLRSAGAYRAARWCLTGELFEATEAQQAGLVSELAPAGKALDVAMARASTIAAMPPLAVAAIREALALGADAPLTTALALERRLFERLFDSDDQKEGMRAFLDKRKPRFMGR